MDTAVVVDEKRKVVFWDGRCIVGHSMDVEVRMAATTVLSWVKANGLEESTRSYALSSQSFVSLATT